MAERVRESERVRAARSASAVGGGESVQREWGGGEGISRRSGLPKCEAPGVVAMQSSRDSCHGCEHDQDCPGLPLTACRFP